jgi:hypothetical protein
MPHIFAYQAASSALIYFSCSGCVPGSFATAARPHIRHLAYRAGEKASEKTINKVVTGCETVSDKHTDGFAALNEQEKHLIQMIREMKFGELHIFVSEGKPVRVEEFKKSIKL